MSESYILDTNAYYLLFDKKKDNKYSRLESLIKSEDGVLKFYISQVTSLEIHSVVGKYKRGVQAQQILCDRIILSGDFRLACDRTWVKSGKGMNSRVYRDVLRLISDVEGGRGRIQASILEIDDSVLSHARRFMMMYSDKYSFGSHDAMIAGTAIALAARGEQVTLVTSDRGLKAALRAANVRYFDPQTAESSCVEETMMS